MPCPSGARGAISTANHGPRRAPSLNASFSHRFEALLARWAGAAARRARTVVVLALLATLATGAYFIANVKINTDTGDMLSDDLPFRKLSGDLSRAFPQFSDNILVVIDGQTADLAADAARTLAAELRRHPKVFGRVVDWADSPFFRKNGLLFLSVEELSDLADRLAAAQPFLGRLWRDPSLRGVFAMVGLAVDEIFKGPSGTPMDLVPTLDAVAAVAEAQNAGRFAHLSWQELMTGKTVAPKDRRRFILIKPTLDYESLNPAAKAMRDLRRIAAEKKLDPAHGVRVRLTGSAALSQEELKSVEDGMGRAGMISVALVVALLVVGLRSARMTVATLLTLIAGLVWTAGFSILAFGSLNLISVAFAVLFIGLGVDFGVHYCLRYREDRADGTATPDAHAKTTRKIGGALTLCAVTTAIGFYAFTPTDYVGLAQLGFIAGTGMFIALFASLTVLPALLALIPPGPAPAATGGGFRLVFTPARARAVVALAAAVGFLSIYATLGARFDFDPLNLKDPKTESVQTLRDLMADGQAGRYSIEVLEKDLAAARATAAKAEKLDVVDEVRSLADFVPKDQDDKLVIVADMALFLAPSLSVAGHDPAPTDTERKAALDALMPKLQRLAKMGDRPEAAPARRLASALGRLAGDGAKLKELEVRLVTALPGRIKTLIDSLDAGPVGLDALPEDLKRDYIAPDGRARLEIVPKVDLGDREALIRFVETVRAEVPNATGTPVTLLESGRAIVRSFVRAVAVAFVGIAVLLFVILRRVREVALVLVPMVLAAAMTGAFSVLFGVPFNYANVIVLPLLFGLSVDFGIHFVLRGREEGQAAVLSTSTPRAMTLSALTTIGSFASIGLSSHPGTASMGVLLTVAVALTLVSALLVLPALTALGRPGGGGKV